MRYVLKPPSGKDWPFPELRLDGRCHPRSAEVRAKASAALKGRKVPPEVLARRVAAQTGLKRSEEFRRRASEKMMGRPCPPAAIAASVAARKGKKLSESHRAKLRAVWQKRKARKDALFRPIFFTAPAIQPRVGRIVRGKAMSGSK